jgi:hypothetical protein
MLLTHMRDSCKRALEAGYAPVQETKLSEYGRRLSFTVFENILKADGHEDRLYLSKNDGKGNSAHAGVRQTPSHSFQH